MFNNAEKQRAFENAISCLYNGYWKEDWNSCELSEWESEEVWNAALYQFEKLVRRCVQASGKTTNKIIFSYGGNYESNI